MSTVERARGVYAFAALLVFMLIGGLLLLNLLVPGNINWGLGVLLLTLSVCFFVAALWQRTFAFLIPACVLAGLSIGLPVVDLLGPVPMIWGLALGFCGLFFLGRALFNEREPWPLFPAGACFVTGVFLLIFR